MTPPDAEQPAPDPTPPPPTASARRAAIEAVRAYEAYLARLQSLHTRCAPPIDWAAEAVVPPPPAPAPVHTREDEAVAAWNAYRPTVKERLLKKADAEEQALLDQIAAAREADEAAYQASRAAHEAAMADGEARRTLAKSVLRGEAHAYDAVLDRHVPFRDLRVLGTGVVCAVVDAGCVRVEVAVHGEQVIPAREKGLTSAGRLATRPMPKARFVACYQDYVCSVVLRVAREVFAALPVSRVMVTAIDAVLNTATGHPDPHPILSVAFTRHGLAALNLARIDPSDAMTNFVHRMQFDPEHGFQHIDPLSPDAFDSDAFNPDPFDPDAFG